MYTFKITGTSCLKSVQLFFEYLYCDLCKDQINESVADDLLMLAIKYDLPRLKMLCYNAEHDGTCSLPDSTLAIDTLICKDAIELSDLKILVEDTNQFGDGTN